MIAKGDPLDGPGRSHGAGDDRHAAGREARGDPLRLRLPSDDAQLHDVVRRLPGLRAARAREEPSRARRRCSSTPAAAIRTRCRGGASSCAEKYGTHAGGRGRGGAEAAAEAGLAGAADGVRVCRAAVREGHHARGTDRRASRTTTPSAAAGRRGCCKKLDAGEKFAASYPYPVHAWRLGKEMLVIGMGAETVVDYALRFKTEFGPGTWVCGYADDMIAYIPSRRVWDEGRLRGRLRTSTNTAARPSAGPATSRTGSPRRSRSW